jgi:uncharacterized protein involved in exopolysaccharide biosynthesis
MALRDRVSQLKEKREGLLITYTKEWPEVKKLDFQIKSLEAELDRVINEMIGYLKAEYQAAQLTKRVFVRCITRRRERPLNKRETRLRWRP